MLVYILYTFTGRQREYVCEHLNNAFSKNKSGGRRCFQCVRTCSWLCVFEDVCGIPYICVYFCRTAAQTCDSEIYKTYEIYSIYKIYKTYKIYQIY